jgi:glycerophosphoryl diester phosphodiesterase
VKIIAHRGASAEAPENTLAAFRRALDLGVEMIELDVQLTRDKVPVVIHDATLARTTNGQGTVSGRDYDAIRRLSAGAWFSERFAEERVPRLSDVHALVAGRADLNVEIKADAGDARETAALALREALRVDTLASTLYSSFDPRALERLRVEDRGARLALLTGPGNLFSEDLAPDRMVRAVLDRVGRWRHLKLEAACLHRLLVTEPLTEELRRLRLPILVYTVDEPGEVARLEALGVSGVFSNDPAPLLEKWGPRASGTR